MSLRPGEVETLPKQEIVRGPGDENLPSRIFAIDQEIESLTDNHNETVQKLQEDREKLFNRALELGIMQDSTCGISAETKLPNQKVDIEKLKRDCAEDFKRICDNLRHAADATHELRIKEISEGTVSLSQPDVKAVIKDKSRFESLLYRPGKPIITYLVRERKDL